MARCEPSFEDIAPAWHSVATLLSARDLCSCIQASKQLRQLSDVEVVWKSLAEGTWHQLANPDTAGYTSYKALVLDDNRQNVALAVALHDVSCMWRYQRPAHLYYECKVLQLQWWRSNNTLRLYFDARGESDLRSPNTSSLAVVALKQPTETPPNPHGRHHSSSSSSSNDSSRMNSAADGPAAGAGHQQQQTAAAAAADPACWSKKLGVFPPDECQLLTNKRGHYKGVLIWSSNQCSQILDLLLPSVKQPQQQQRQQQQSSPQPPLPQHMHQQRARRSQAFEEWADWELNHQDDADAAGAASASTARSHRAVFTSTTSSSTRPGSSASGSHSSASRDGWLEGLERRLMAQLDSIRGRTVASSSSAQASAAAADSGGDQILASSSQPSMSDVAAAMERQQQQHALVFCYANNLAHADAHNTFSLFGVPDYSIVPLMVVPPDQPAGITEACTGAATAAGAVTQPVTRTTPGTTADNTHVPVNNGNSALPAVDAPGPVAVDHGDLQGLQLLYEEEILPPPDAVVNLEHPIHALGMGFPGLLFPHMPGPAPYNMRRVHHMNTHWVPPGNAAVREGRWAAEWLELPGAGFAARGRLYSELQDESEDAEVARWSGLPEAVKQRGEAWWV